MSDERLNTNRPRLQWQEDCTISEGFARQTGNKITGSFYRTGLCGFKEFWLLNAALLDHLQEHVVNLYLAQNLLADLVQAGLDRGDLKNTILHGILAV